MYWVIKFRDTNYYYSGGNHPSSFKGFADEYDTLEEARLAIKKVKQPRTQKALDMILDHGEPYIVKVGLKKSVVHKWRVLFNDMMEVIVHGPTIMEAVQDEIEESYIKDINSIVKVS